MNPDDAYEKTVTLVQRTLVLGERVEVLNDSPAPIEDKYIEAARINEQLGEVIREMGGLMIELIKTWNETGEAYDTNN